MGSLNECVVIAALNGDLGTDAEAFEVRVRRVTEEYCGVNLGLVDDFFLARAGADELESTEEAGYVPIYVNNEYSTEKGCGTHKHIPSQRAAQDFVRLPCLLRPLALPSSGPEARRR